MEDPWLVSRLRSPEDAFPREETLLLTLGEPLGEERVLLDSCLECDPSGLELGLWSVHAGIYCFGVTDR